MEQKLLGDNNNPEKWGTQLETHLMEMEVNKNRRLGQLIHEIQTAEKEKEKEE